MEQEKTEAVEAHPAQVELSRVFSSVRLMGPPFNDKLIRLVAHLFSPEEAAVARHLPFYYPRPLEKIAKKAKRDAAELKPVLDVMAQRRVIYGGAKGYSLLPLIPGMFEYMLMTGVDTEWHRKYAELLIDMFSTGYVRKYNATRAPFVRNIPVQAAISGQSVTLDADLISEMIDAHQDFAVANVCQCRQSLKFIGKDCKRAAPEDGCLVFGSFARNSEKSGNGRNVNKQEMRDIVTERWEKNLVFMTGNVGPGSPNAICTCCDCCCHALETFNHYEGKALIAPPHFLARVDFGKCKNCGKCARVCNTYAHTKEKKEHHYDVNRCIGCGLCVAACKQGAITLVENPNYKPPSRDFKRLALRLLPATAMTAVRAKLLNR